LVLVALVALAAVAVLIAGGVFDATAAVTVLVAFVRQRIADDVFEFLAALALALPIPVATAAAVLTSQCAKAFRARDPAGQQTADTRSCHRLKQPAPPGLGGGLLDETIERLVVHAVAPSLAQPTIMVSRHVLSPFGQAMILKTRSSRRALCLY
jgi:hypothetical protein